MTRTKTLHNALHAKGKTLFATCILALLATFVLQAQTVRYVKETATGTGDGTSWANASADLQAMINASAVDDEVRVAAGTYKPTKDPFGNASPGDTRDKTFYVKDGVKIYGGFSASAPEATLAARSITTNVTTLSGDFNSDDAIAGSGSTLDITNNGENAYHVVLSAAPSTGGIGITVDGFTIKGGNASTNGSFTLNGYTVYRSNAGGIYTHYGTNTLSNNTLSGNSAIYNGGAIYTNFGTNTLNNNTVFSNKIDENGGGIGINEGANTLTNNIISGNKTIYYAGAGIYINKGINTLTNNTFSDNAANTNGGGVCTNNGTNTLTNNIFWNNKVGTDATVASADYHADGTNGNTFTNNLLQLAASNYAVSNTGNYAIGAAASGNIFAQNPSFVNAADLDGADNIHRTADDGLQILCGSPAINTGITPPLGVGGLDILGNAIFGSIKDMGAYESQIALPTAYNMTGGGNYTYATPSNIAVGLANSEMGVTYQLKNGAIDVGSAEPSTGTSINFGFKTTGVYTVVATRTSDGCIATMTGNAVVTSTVFCPSGTTLHVNASVSGGTGDGSSWANAYASLSEALFVAHSCNAMKTIKVATGIYKPTKKPVEGGVEMSTGNDRDRTFHIPDGVTIEGGYNAAMGSRDITANVTTLSGDFSSDDIVIGSGNTLFLAGNSENAYQVVITSANSSTGIGVTIDGFTIKGGNADNSATIILNGNTLERSKGGGIYTNYGTNMLNNNIISENHAEVDGGGIYTYYGTNTLSNNIISENRAYVSGGGIFMSKATSTLTNNTISGNVAVFNNGGAIYTDSGTNTMSNNTLSDNSAYNGGAIYTDYGINTLNNNTISENKTVNGNGGGIYAYEGTNTLSNNTLSENSAKFGGGIFSYSGRNTLTNNIISKNSVTKYGGGIVFYSGTNMLNNNIISKNSATEFGGGILTFLSTNTLTNNILSGNSATIDGGGIYANNSENSLNNNTFSGNSAGNSGGGIFTLTGTNTLTNNIFWDNKQGNTPSATIAGADYFVYSSTNTFINNSLQLAASNYTTTGIGNYDLGTAASDNIFAQDPLFVNAADLDGADNIHRTEDDGLGLQNISPAINAGISGVGIPTTDITGGNHVGLPDMGAYEVLCSRLLVNICLSAVLSGTQTACANASVNLKAIVTNGTAPFTVVITNGTLPDITVNNYVSGADIAVSNSTTKTYTLASIKDATNASGVVSGSATITVDETLPTINMASVPTNVIVDCNNIPTEATVTANNACSTVTMNETSTKGTDNTQCNFYNYKITRTWTATDKRSNTATVSQEITVSASAVQGITPLANITVTEAEIPITISLPSNSCMNAGIVSFTQTSAVGVPPACFTYLYTLTRTWKVTDACNNTVTLPQTIVVRGIRLTCPSDKIFTTTQDGSNDYNCSTLLLSSQGVAPTFLDNCQSTILQYMLTGATMGNGTGSVAGIRLNAGETNVKYNLLHNGSDVCTFKITIKDQELPKIVVPTLNVIDGCEFTTVALDALKPTLSDNCSAPTLELISETMLGVSGCATKTATAKYTKSMTRTWKVTDASNNTKTAIQVIYLRDMVAPTASCKNGTATIGNTNITFSASNLNDASSDNCNGALTYKACLGTNCTSFTSTLTLTKLMIQTGQNQASVPVRLQVSDACANISICSTSIILKKQVAPLINGNSNNPTTIVAHEATTTPREASEVPTAHGDLKCFPNPFTEDLNLQYNLTQDVSIVTLKIYDNQGRIVAKDEQGESPAGFYQMRWNLSDLAPAMYHICLEIDGKCMKTERVVLLK